jgi:SAM-dependent methyltransferase
MSARDRISNRRNPVLRMNINQIKRVIPRSLRPYLGAMRRWLRSMLPRPRLQKQRLLSDPSLTETERELLSKVSGKIYFNDTMYDGDGAHYYKVGLSAIRCIDSALAQAKLTTLRTILDLPCGSGRVLRFLTQRFPEAEITACEIQRAPVQFCVRTFGARPAYSSVKLDEVELEKKFDLIWCGSLATHLNERDIIALFRLFIRHLEPGGLVVLTTHGDFAAQRASLRQFDYSIPEDQIERIGRDYPQTGYGFVDYAGERNWGVSLTSPEWIRALVRKLGGLREVYFKESGWDNHQDVFGFVLE